VKMGGEESVVPAGDFGVFSAAGAFRLKENARLETKSTKRMALRSGGFGWGIRHLPW
jgi:hypothetical protein